MVLISDGRSTATPQSGALTLDEAARRLKQAGVPVSTIATGTAEPLRDLALIDLAAPKEANLDDMLSLRVTVVNHIEPGLQTELTLLEDGKPKVVRKVRLAAGRNDVVLSLIVEGQDARRPQVHDQGAALRGRADLRQQRNLGPRPHRQAQPALPVHRRQADRRVPLPLAGPDPRSDHQRLLLAARRRRQLRPAGQDADRQAAADASRSGTSTTW